MVLLADNVEAKEAMTVFGISPWGSLETLYVDGYYECGVHMVKIGRLR